MVGLWLLGEACLVGGRGIERTSNSKDACEAIDMEIDDMTKGMLKDCTATAWRAVLVAILMVATSFNTTWSGTVSGDASGPSLQSDQPEVHPKVSVKSSDNSGLIIDMDLPGIRSWNDTVEQRTYQHIEMPSAALTTKQGAPELPMVYRYLEIPRGINVSVEVLYSDHTTGSCGLIYPAQPSPPAMKTNETPPFVIDNLTYATDAFYPPMLGSAQPLGVMRGHRIAGLSVYPVQVNPVTAQLRVYSKIELRVRYSQPAQVGLYDGRLLSEPFEQLMGAVVMNYDTPRIENTSGTSLMMSMATEGADYLIITNETLVQSVQPLKDWKERKGLTVKVVTTAEISTDDVTADDIIAYVDATYDWALPPTYLLLVGDAELIPPNYRNPHSAWLPDEIVMTASDLYYACVDLDENLPPGQVYDTLPDMFIGRIPVDDPDQATTVVEKILAYEKFPPDDLGFYSNITLASYFQDYYPEDALDGREDSGYRFIWDSEKVRNPLISAGYNVERIYYAFPEVDPRFFNNGDPLPDDLLRSNGFAWDGYADDIINAFNNGSFLVCHHDHGSPTRWCNPSFGTTINFDDVSSLTNAEKLSLVFSLNCMSGWFDEEIDNWSYGPPEESLCENFIRRDGGGAVAVIGATRITWVFSSGFLLEGMCDALFGFPESQLWWPSFDPVTLAPRVLGGAGPFYQLGQMFEYGRAYMLGPSGHDWIAMYNGQAFENYEGYHLFGDPEMSVWTRAPDTLSVDYPGKVGSGGLQEFVVTVRNSTCLVPDAKVCLSFYNGASVVGLTDEDGQVILEVEPETGGILNITVTKPNNRPYEGEIIVTESGAHISLYQNVGPPGETFNITGVDFLDDERVIVDFGGSLLTTGIASNGAISLPCTVANKPDGAYNIVAIGQTSGRAAVRVFTIERFIDPYIHTNLAPLSSSGRMGKFWDNPDIKVYLLLDNGRFRFKVDPSRLLIGCRYSIEATVHNNGVYAAEDTKVTFKWCPLFLGGYDSEIIGTDFVDVPPGPGTAVASVNFVPETSGFVAFIVELEHPEDTNLLNNRGMLFKYVKAISSPGTMVLTVGNPTNASALVRLDVTQRGVDGEASSLWGSEIQRSYPQVLGPGEYKDANLTVFAPDNASVGDARVFSVTSSIDGVVTGGVECVFIKDHLPILSDAQATASRVEVDRGVGFRVDYADEDDHPPGGSTVFLVIKRMDANGSVAVHEMLDGDPIDTVYKDGKPYTFNVSFTEPGDYLCSFFATDGCGIAAIGMATQEDAIRLTVDPREDHVHPVINHTPPQTWRVGEAMPLTAFVTDDVVVTSVELRYRIAGEANYSMIEMSLSGNNSWMVIIPGDVVTAEGLEYFILASDGINEVTYPIGGASDPVVVKDVFPPDTGPPIISHVPPLDWWLGEAQAIVANITDDVGVKDVTLFYRVRGTANYSMVSMERGDGDAYAGLIPRTSITTVGLEYYIAATDSAGHDAICPAAGAQQPVLVTSVRERDVTKPIINPTPPPKARVGSNLTITVVATDDAGLSEVKLYYRMRGDETWNAVVMTPNGGVYSSTVPKSDLRKGTLEYYIEVRDVNGNVERYGTVDEPISMKVEGKEKSPGFGTLVACLCLVMTAIAISRRSRMESKRPR